MYEMNTDLRLQTLADRTVVNYRRGNDYRWVACLAASRIVGQYQNGATKELAGALSLTVSQVENLAAAGLCYRMFRRFGVNSEVRRRLTPSHFAAMLDLWKRYEMEPYEVAAQLQTAAENGASVAAMRANILGEMGASEFSILAALDTLMAKSVQAAERLPAECETRRDLERGVEWLRQARESAEREGLK